MTARAFIGWSLLVCPVLLGCDEKSPVVATSVEITPLGTGKVTIRETNLNRDWRTRDAILRLSVKWGTDDLGGTVRVEAIDLAALEKLLAANFIDPMDRQNAAPTVREIMDFMGAHTGTIASGYAVSPERPDYRVSIDGILVPKERVTPATVASAKTLCQEADEVILDPEVYCWWD